MTPMTKNRFGIERLAGADHVVPPARVAGVLAVGTGNVVRCIERMADQHRVGAIGVQRSVCFIHQRVTGNLRAALQWQRRREEHGLR